MYFVDSHATNIHLNSNTTDSSTLQSPFKHTEKNENGNNLKKTPFVNSHCSCPSLTKFFNKTA